MPKALLPVYYIDRTSEVTTSCQSIACTIDIRGFTGLETPNELHNRGALTDAHAHAALIILMAVKGDQYSLLSKQLK